MSARPGGARFARLFDHSIVRPDATRTEVSRVLTVCLALALPVPAATSPSNRTFRDSVCHVSFEYPDDWAVETDSSPAAEACTYLVRPLAYDSLLLANDSVDVHTVFVQVIPQPPEVAAEDAGFEPRGRGWVILGRWGAETSGSPYRRGRLHGVTGIAAGGCYRVRGSYVGACDLPAALVGDEARSVAIRGGPRSEDVVSLIVDTIELED